MGRTGLMGRGMLGHYGPNHYAGAIVSRFYKGRLQFIAAEQHSAIKQYCRCIFCIFWNKQKFLNRF